MKRVREENTNGKKEKKIGSITRQQNGSFGIVPMPPLNNVAHVHFQPKVGFGENSVISKIRKNDGKLFKNWKNK